MRTEVGPPHANSRISTAAKQTCHTTAGLYLYLTRPAPCNTKVVRLSSCCAQCC